MDILTKLGINWQLLIAQIVNFAIIAGVLTYFVYRPVLNLLDARRERIRKAMEDVERIENQKKDMEELRTKRLTEADQEAGTLLEEAKKQGEQTRDDIIAAAKREADEMIAKGRQLIAAERRQAYEEVHQNLAQLIIKLTEKILEREFTPADQKRLVTTLEKELPKTQR